MSQQPIRRKPVPSRQQQAQQQTPQPGWERAIANQFRHALSTERMAQLSRRSSHQRSHPTGPSRSSSSASSTRLPPPSRAPSGRSRPNSNSSHHQFSLPMRHGTGSRLLRDPPLDDFSYGVTPSAAAGAAATAAPLANIPLVPTPPTEPRHFQFRNQLMLLSEAPLKWENPGLLDEAMRSIPLERIYGEAEDESELLRGEAASVDGKPRWAHQDCVVRALLRWFRADFFTWVNNPPCSVCGHPTVAHGFVAPVPEELALSGQQVELYKCASAACGSYERFPRYSDAFVLLQTRRGRLGEWTSCFGMLCRAVGSRVRWVWNSEDHAWIEVYSDYRKRWVHVDATEGLFDKPLLYAQGWGKKLGYCIAFGADGAMDVSGRYCRNPSRYGEPRSRCPEAVLHHIMDEIRRMRRRDKGKDEKFKLEGEDMRETHELRHYYIAGFVDELASMVPGGRRERRRADADAQKAAESREGGTTEWTRARAGDEQTGPHGDRPPQ